MNIYDLYSPIENEKYVLRLVKKEDCDALFKVYSDINALPFFNSDNCDGDNFYYATKERMAQALDFWDYAYQNRWFARFTIIDKAAGIIGTVELCLRVSDDAFDNTCILRVDLRSDKEKEDVLYELFSLLLSCLSTLTGDRAVITKVPLYAVERAKAADRAGFTKSAHYLIGKTGYPYDGYRIKQL